jgi:hypothetical protein
MPIQMYVRGDVAVIDIIASEAVGPSPRQERAAVDNSCIESDEPFLACDVNTQLVVMFNDGVSTRIFW